MESVIRCIELGAEDYPEIDAASKLQVGMLPSAFAEASAAQPMEVMARTCNLVRMATELWQRLGAECLTPAQIAKVVKRELCQTNRNCMFVTLFLGILATRIGVLTYVTAGHPEPFLLRASGVIEGINGKPDVPPGILATAAYQNQSIDLLAPKADDVTMLALRTRPARS